MTGQHAAARVAYALTLDLSHGPHGAHARIEWFEAGAPEEGGAARLALFGWIDRLALGGLEGALADLVERGVRCLSLDCSRVRHIEFAALPALTIMLERFAREPGGLRLTGLSPHLRDLFRSAAAAGPAPAAAPGEPGPETAAPAIVSLLPGLAREWAT